MAQKETPWFYHPNFEDSELLPDEARHAGSALRLQVGARVRLTNGRGKLATATIQEIKKGRVKINIISTDSHFETANQKTLITGRLHHTDRLEWLVEKVQELGIGRLLITEMDHCGPGKLNLERLTRISISALKQSHQPFLCQLVPSKSIQEAIESCSGQGVFGYLSENTTAVSITQHSQASFAVIGPEADFSADEVSTMLAKGLSPVSLGQTRLRTETAAIAAAVYLQI